MLTSVLTGATLVLAVRNGHRAGLKDGRNVKRNVVVNSSIIAHALAILVAGLSVGVRVVKCFRVMVRVMTVGEPVCVPDA